MQREMSVGLASLRRVNERWSRDQVLALAPDASSRKAADRVSASANWSSCGATGAVLYGECRGSGEQPYLACVDLTGPAYRCSCPSRKFPCKHALGLLLLWSADEVPAAGTPPPWVSEWVDGRAARAAASADRAETLRTDAAQKPSVRPTDLAVDQPVRQGGAASDDGTTGEGGAASDGEFAREEGVTSDGEFVQEEGVASGGGSVRQGGGSVRHGRVASGLAELERWLADQVRQGLAGTAEHDWEGLAKRLVDAQAPGVAGLVSRLPRVRREDDWPGRLLEEYALLNLLAVAYRRRAGLPGPLARTVLIRAGFPVTREEVLAGPAVRDRWHVLGRRDEEQDHLTARRVWLLGRDTGRHALILSFAPQGQSLDASLVTGTVIDADLAFYPGAAPLRALVAVQHGHDTTAPPTGLPPEQALDEVARALADDPWTESWPLVLSDVVPGRDSLGGLPLHPRARDPWRLIAVSGGRPLTVATEWTPQGLRPLTTWDDDDTAVIL